MIGYLRKDRYMALWETDMSRRMKGFLPIDWRIC